jgi:hypothetical protein
LPFGRQRHGRGATIDPGIWNDTSGYESPREDVESSDRAATDLNPRTVSANKSSRKPSVDPELLQRAADEPLPSLDPGGDRLGQKPVGN